MARIKKRPTTVAALRELMGLTQYRLAKKAGLSQTHLRKIELGLIKSPSAAVAMAIADALGADVRDLFPARDRKAA
jgi:transcriptional regulator with XRE-family HTH domain